MKKDTLTVSRKLQNDFASQGAPKTSLRECARIAYRIGLIPDDPFPTVPTRLDSCPDSAVVGKRYSTGEPYAKQTN